MMNRRKGDAGMNGDLGGVGGEAGEVEAGAEVVEQESRGVSWEGKWA